MIFSMPSKQFLLLGVDIFGPFSLAHFKPHLMARTNITISVRSLHIYAQEHELYCFIVSR